ncbi:hypothetical protein [Methylobacterium oryzihabitans]|uniref:hypothetical protein n=1 Tax=Methylobacterium oryzihabitans TaxID=2499852 RepID=UPI001FEBC11E|nr:hypothetical protein [Methylobacterium oryzihabitans]
MPEIRPTIRLAALAAALLAASGAGAQTLEMEQRLRTCLHEKAQHPADDGPAKASLQQKAEHLLGRCDTDKAAWLNACTASGNQSDCARRAEVRAVGALQDGKGAEGGGKGGH